MYRILLLEDEKNIRDVVKLNLECEQYEVDTAVTGQEALKKAFSAVYHLYILDVMVPEIDGLEVCEKIRLNNVDTPILILTAKDSADDKVKGLRKGADDYITKPFHLEEFLLRVKNLLRRSKVENNLASSDVFTWDNMEIQFSQYKAKGKSGHIDLTKKECDLLHLLIERRNEVVSRNDILKFVWGYDVFPSTRTIDNFIMNFRKIFEDDPKNPKYFLSVRGVGYKFAVLEGGVS
jgi:two-component system alkaline phosphatase synthesis response regulator PhoP